MEHPLYPLQQAAELRLKAERLEGSERDHCLWLAREWEKTAERHATGARAGKSAGHPLPAPGAMRRR